MPPVPRGLQAAHRQCCCFLQVAYEGFFQRGVAAVLDEREGLSLARTFPACISEMRSQSLGFVHEVGGNEDSDLIAAREIDHQLPEAVARYRIDAGSRSSRISRSGLWITATPVKDAGAAPNGRASGKVSMKGPSRKRSAISATRAGISALGKWNRFACSFRFCRTVSSE